jgi:hypothetical protein
MPLTNADERLSRPTWIDRRQVRYYWRKNLTVRKFNTGWLCRIFCMGTYSELYVDDYPLYSTKSQVDPIVMTIFRESDRRVYERKVCERSALNWGEIPDDGETEMAYEYRNTAKNIKQRLDVMGFCLGRVKLEFDARKRDEMDYLKSLIEEESGNPPDSQGELLTIREKVSDTWQKQLDLLQESSLQDFMAAFRVIFQKRLLQYYDIGSEEDYLVRYILKQNDEEYYYNFPCTDIRSFIRAFLEVCPADTPIIQDITELVDGEYYGPTEAVCAVSTAQLTESYPVNERIIILTEGSIDRRVLESSVGLLYPHLSEYYSFMDFGISNASGSAGTLINTIKAFVGSGIINRVIAIFDNDTAANVALRGLRKTSIPPNIKVLKYPNIEIAKDYPTLGPSGVSNLDVNGLACSIELYFGLDVLKLDGDLIPIQWKGYDESLGQYQGEILRKQELQSRFFAKIENCVQDRSLIDKTDWQPMDAVLSNIFQAFQRA